MGEGQQPVDATRANPVRVASPALRRYWYPVALSDEVTDSPFAARLLGEELVLWRSGGEVHAFRDLCIHRGARLSLGWVDESGLLVCGYHGWGYGPSGRCTRIPSLPPERGIPGKARATLYRAAERYGLVWVCLGEPVAPIPECPEFEDPTYRRWSVIRPQHWNASAARIVENGLDTGHLAWVHRGVIGVPSSPLIPDHEVERRGNELWFDITLETVADHRFRKTTSANFTFRLIPPFVLQFWRKVSDRHRYTALTVLCPLSDTETRYAQIACRNYDLEKPDETFSEVNQVITAQDKAIIESQRPELLPLDLREELHLKGPDAGALRYRQLLVELGFGDPG